MFFFQPAINSDLLLKIVQKFNWLFVIIVKLKYNLDNFNFRKIFKSTFERGYCPWWCGGPGGSMAYVAGDGGPE